jgi:hypothetical protein
VGKAPQQHEPRNSTNQSCFWSQDHLPQQPSDACEKAHAERAEIGVRKQVVIVGVAEEKWLYFDIAVKLMVYVLQPGAKHLVSDEFQMS